MFLVSGLVVEVLIGLRRSGDDVENIVLWDKLGLFVFFMMVVRYYYLVWFESFFFFGGEILIYGFIYFD